MSMFLKNYVIMFLIVVEKIIIVSLLLSIAAMLFVTVVVHPSASHVNVQREEVVANKRIIPCITVEDKDLPLKRIK